MSDELRAKPHLRPGRLSTTASTRAARNWAPLASPQGGRARTGFASSTGPNGICAMRHRRGIDLSPQATPPPISRWLVAGSALNCCLKPSSLPFVLQRAASRYNICQVAFPVQRDVRINSKG